MKISTKVSYNNIWYDIISYEIKLSYDFIIILTYEYESRLVYVDVDNSRL